ncbi:MAG: heme exporter protein CcmB [Bacteroidota bacterium]
MKHWIRATLGVFLKDMKSELRTRYALNALIMFVIITLSMILFSFGNEIAPQFVLSGILWIIIFFAAMSGLSRTFVSEEERGTVLTLQLLTHSSSVFFGKLLLNILLSCVINTLIVVLYLLLISNFTIQTWSIFLLILLLGSLGLASGATIVAAIVAKANTKGTLYPVLAFPILLPLLIAVISGTQMAVEGASFASAGGLLQFLFSYLIVFTTLPYLLFDYIWKE